MERRLVTTVLAEVKSADDRSFAGWIRVDVEPHHGGVLLRIDDRCYWFDAENAQAIVEVVEGAVT